MSFLNHLNDRQKEAAETLTGPLLIIAGAGSGKTRALTYRIAHLIQQGMAQPGLGPQAWQILAVTFTNKAAGEMQRRVEELLTKNFNLSEKNRPVIGTFHSICVRILRKYIERLGREKSFVIYDATDQQGLMKRLIKEEKLDDEKIKPQVALAIISKFKNELKGAEDFRAVTRSYFEKQVAILFAAYEKRLRDNNALDFDDLLLYTVKLFRENPDVLDEYRERWRYISIDEYQDTNHAQYTLAKLLAAKYRNLCVIGDSDQSIYSFRGADITNILDFEKDYPDAKVIKLEQNYRSTQVILDAADSIIEKNRRRKAKKMWTDQKGGDLVEVIHAHNENEEANFVAREIDRLMRQKQVSLKDIVVLYRTNAQSRILEEALLRHGLPYKVIGGVKFYARKEIKDVLAYLRVILNPNDTDSLLRIINIPPRRIGETSIHKLQAFAMGRSLSVAEVLMHIEMVDELSAKTRDSLSNFWKMMLGFKKQVTTLKVSELLRKIVREVGFKAYLMDGTEEGEMRYENVMELISVASKYDESEPEFALAYFLEEVALVADTDQITEDISTVTLMTLHSVKGLEYPYVFIAGCEESIFPHSRALLEEAGMEEERRLMYVGVTRAMRKLYLLAAKQRMLYGDYQANPMSRFIADIPEHLMETNGLESVEKGVESHGRWTDSRRTEVITEKSDPLIAEKKFKDGDHVRHATFGEGMVVERRGDLVTIAFKDKKIGIKKFAANIAPLEKL